jgi:hypothetical protein
MAIRIARNDAGNCINFFGSSNPTYWNAVLEGEINEDNPNNVNVVNTVRTLEQESVVYEFFNLPYTDFVDKDENVFENASECAQYITDNANVSGTSGTFIFNQTDTLDAQREATNTTVLFSNGDIFAVNSLHASAASNGTIKIDTIVGDKDVYLNLRYYNVSVNNGAVSFNNINAAVDRLNEVLSGQAVGSDSGTAGSDANTESADGSFTIYGDRITNVGDVYTSTREVGNFDTANGMISNETISEPGEYFEFIQNSDWNSAGTGFTFGLFDETTYDQSDLEEDVAGNAVKNVLRLRIKNTNFIFTDPDSTYGKINEIGFSDDLKTKLTYRLGLDSAGRAYIGYMESGILVTVGRTESAIAAGTELKLNVIMPLENELDGIGGFTVNTLDDSPALTWYYIESPDGDFYYPLFNSQEQANYVDEQYGTAADDAGSSHQHLFVDEQPSQNIWYMPDTYMFHAESSAPSTLAGVVWNEIATGDDANYVPSQYADNTVTVNEGDAINLQIRPQGDASTYNLTGIPTGLAFDGFGNLVGNAPQVLQDNVTNPSDTFTITVTKANDYGSSIGTLTLVVNNTTAPATALSGFTWQNTSTPLVDSTTMDEGSVVYLDDTLQDGKRFVIDEAWVETNVLPNLTTTGDIIIIGARAASPSWGTIGFSNGIPNDFTIGMYWQKLGTGGVKSVLFNGTTNSLDINSATDAVYDFGFEVDGTSVSVIACSTSDINTEPGLAHGGSFERILTDTSYSETIPLEIAYATVSAEAGLSTSGISEIDIPATPTMETNWTKAIKFSGSNEHLQKVNTWSGSNALLMDNISQVVAGNSNSANTSNISNARPWAIAIVFKSDGNSSNQHIWNSGDGAGSTDDNIYLRTDANGLLYFGWGRSGSLNECRLGGQAITGWRAVYIAHKGTRLSGSNATAANLADCFDIRVVNPTNNWDLTYVYNVSTTANWITTGGRMDRTVRGDFTIGGRGSNRSFHGKVASMVVTTLKIGVAMPTNAEIELMITDPKKWEDDYRIGQTVRRSQGTSNVTYANSSVYNGHGGTQIWLMGDGTSDSFSNGVRNDVYAADQNYGKLQFNSMQSNDIVNVTISGLS